ncbi:MAG: hypothetical protein WCS69_11850 [Ignavibacteriaceae bacterium]|jgi:hypothetical protein
MNKTEKALLARGFDTNLIASLLGKGYSLSKLKTKSKNDLLGLGIHHDLIEIIQKESRPPISDKIVSELIYDSKMICCICRESNRPIIIHHIIPWNESHDNSEENLVVLCLEHHDLAHTRKELSINLTANHIRNAKDQWIDFVRLNDSIQIIKSKHNLSAPTELINLLKLLSLDKDTTANVQDWFIGATPDSPINWETIGVVYDDKKGSYRKGTITVKINGKPYFKLEKNIVPVNWNIILYGARVGVIFYELYPEIMSQEIMSQEINHDNIIEYLEENDFILNLIGRDSEGMASRGKTLYEMIIPGQKQGYLLVEYEYAGAGCSLFLTHYYEKPSKNHLDI